MNYNYESSRSKKIIAIALAATFVILVTILISVSVANRRTTPEDTTTPDTSDTTVTDTTKTEEPPKDSSVALPTFISPVATGTVSYEFSNSVPVFSLTMNDFRTHDGVDISSPLGAEVYAVADGTVTEVWEDVRMGTCVSIAHEGGAISVYKNLNPELATNIVKDATVKSGDVIGLVGESAMIEIAEDSHLHYELSINNELVDPCEYIQFPSEEIVNE